MTAVCRALTVVVVGAFFVGCETSVDTHHDDEVDFSRYQTWAFAPEVAERDPELTPDDRSAEKGMQGAIEDELAARGYVQLPADRAQLLVLYHVSLTRRMEAADIDRYYGLNNAYFGGQMKGARPVATSYDEGSMVIDLIEREGRERVWRGLGRTRMDASKTPSDVRRDIRDAVSEVMKGYPPK